MFAQLDLTKAVQAAAVLLQCQRMPQLSYLRLL